MRLGARKGDGPLGAPVVAEPLEVTVFRRDGDSSRQPKAYRTPSRDGDINSVNTRSYHTIR